MSSPTPHFTVTDLSNIHRPEYVVWNVDRTVTHADGTIFYGTDLRVTAAAAQTTQEGHDYACEWAPEYQNTARRFGRAAFSTDWRIEPYVFGVDAD